MVLLFSSLIVVCIWVGCIFSLVVIWEMIRWFKIVFGVLRVCGKKLMSLL